MDENPYKAPPEQGEASPRQRWWQRWKFFQDEPDGTLPTLPFALLICLVAAIAGALRIGWLSAR